MLSPEYFNRHRRLAMHLQKEERAKLNMLVSFLLVLILSMSLCIGMLNCDYAEASDSAGTTHILKVESNPCYTDITAPVADFSVLQEYDAPVLNWNPGHRGIDIAAAQGTPLIAPADGVISFAGTVAKKSVVSIRHSEMIFTFEPAQTSLAVGTQIKQGETFGYVQGESNHCEQSCVHWGVKNSIEQYFNPLLLLARHKVVLKSLADRAFSFNFGKIES